MRRKTFQRPDVEKHFFLFATLDPAAKEAKTPLLRRTLGMILGGFLQHPPSGLLLLLAKSIHTTSDGRRRNAATAELRNHGKLRIRAQGMDGLRKAFQKARKKRDFICEPSKAIFCDGFAERFGEKGAQ
jgi:hypothetical protein